MNNRAYLIVIVAVGTLFGSVGIAKAVGYWSTESSKVPVTISDGEFAGAYDPGDIRGSYTFEDIEASFGVPPAALAEAFGFETESPGGIQAKQLEQIWEGLDEGEEVGTDSIRLFTALWAGLPHQPEPTTVLPMTAVRLLDQQGKISPKTAAALSERAVGSPNADSEPIDGGTAAADSSAVKTEGESHDIPDRTVRGLTTFGDLKGWGVTEQAWEEAVGLPMGARSASLKDWAGEQGRAMSELKGLAQALVDAAP